MAEAVFSVKDLVKTFPNGYEGLKGLSLDVYRGECLLIAGPNGSGKTLLVRLLLGLSEPSAGEIRFRGVSLDRAAAALRREAGMVFQDADAQIIGETVAEDTAFGPKNLGLAGEDLRDRVSAALAAVGLAGKEEFPPRRLSGGEKRRLAVAGVLAMGCETVILDEPFANLDWPGVVQALRLIRDLKGAGKTLIILTHELEKVLAFADRLVILAGGLIRDQGNPGEVLDRLKEEYGIRDPRRSYRSVGDCTWLD